MANRDNHITQTNKERIELRSDKTRRFIDEEPTFVIRYGTIVIILLLMAVAVITYCTFS